MPLRKQETSHFRAHQVRPLSSVIYYPYLSYDFAYLGIRDLDVAIMVNAHMEECGPNWAQPFGPKGDTTEDGYLGSLMPNLVRRMRSGVTRASGCPECHDLFVIAIDTQSSMNC